MIEKIGFIFEILLVNFTGENLELVKNPSYLVTTFNGF